MTLNPISGLTLTADYYNIEIRDAIVEELKVTNAHESGAQQ